MLEPGNWTQLDFLQLSDIFLQLCAAQTFSVSDPVPSWYWREASEQTRILSWRLALPTYRWTKRSNNSSLISTFINFKACKPLPSQQISLYLEDEKINLVIFVLNVIIKLLSMKLHLKLKFVFEKKYFTLYFYFTMITLPEFSNTKLSQTHYDVIKP